MAWICASSRFSLSGAIFVLKLGCRPKPWGFGLTIKKGSLLTWNFCYSLVASLIGNSSQTYIFLWMQRQVFDQQAEFHRSDTILPASSVQVNSCRCYLSDPNQKGLRHWGQHFFCQLTRFATFEQPWWLDWSSQDTSDSVLFSTYCFGPSAAWRYFGDQGWQLTSLDHPRQLDHGDLLGLPQWFCRVSNAVRTTSRSQRTQRSGVVSPSISISNFLLPIFDDQVPNLRLMFQGGAPQNSAGLWPCCRTAFVRIDGRISRSLAAWHGMGDTVTRWHGDTVTIARVETKVAKQEKIRWRRGGPSWSFSLRTFEYQWIAFLGAKWPRGPKRGWAEMGQVAYNMLSYAMGYNYIIIPNKPVSVFPLNNQSTNVFFSWLIWSLSAMSEGMKWFQSRQKYGAGHECYEYDTPGWPPYAVFKLVPWLHGHLRFQKASGPSGPHGFHGHLGCGRSWNPALWQWIGQALFSTCF